MQSFKPTNGNPFTRFSNKPKADIVTKDDALNRELSEILTKYDHEQLAKLRDMIVDELAEDETDVEHDEETLDDEMAEHSDDGMEDNAADEAKSPMMDLDDEV